MFLIMRFLGSVILFLFFTFSVHAKVKIITIGDSTMAEYDPSEYHIYPEIHILS